MAVRSMFQAALVTLLLAKAGAFAPHPTRCDATTVLRASSDDDGNAASLNRRDLLSRASAVMASAGILASSGSQPALAAPMDVEDFLKSGGVAMPMGVSGQAGKARPVTGVVLREGSDVSRDERSGNVLAEILLGSSSNPTAVLASFSSPWKLETGPLFDVECRDSKTGDGAFLAVTGPTGGKSIADLPKSFFVDSLFSPTGRFSFYGQPTDIKAKKSTVEGPYRYIELSFSNLSQSTNAEIPRNAVVSATIPEGTDRAVMLVASATASRWKKGAEDSVRKTVESFRANPAPVTGMKIRAKERGSASL